MVIAIDGPSGVGKSTVARGIAAALHIPYLDTGSTYRAATLAVLRAGIDPTDEDAIVSVLGRHQIGYGPEGVELSGEHVAAAVRSPEVTAAVSAVSAHPRVREHIVEMQRDWVEAQGGSAVVEGRDIGTVVFPDTKHKIYLTARSDVRASRRSGDAEASGTPLEELRSALEARDRADSTRKASPLKPAEDAHILDTSDLDVDQVIAAALSIVLGTGSDTEDTQGLRR